MKKVLILIAVSTVLSGCMVKGTSEGIWVGMTWSQAGWAAGKVLPQKIEDIVAEKVQERYIEEDVEDGD